MNDRREAAPVGIVEATPDGTITAINDRAQELLEIDRDRAVGSSIDGTLPQSVEAAVPAAFDGPIEGPRSIEEYYPVLDRWFEVTLVPGDDAVAVYLQDRTPRRRSKRRVESLEGELDRLAVLDEVVSDILAELVDASSREAIAETICERLGRSDLYEFAWLGERKVGGEAIVVRAAAGSTGRTLDHVTECLTDGRPCPERRAIESGQPQVIQPIAAEESIPEPIRRAAFADGLQSMLAIPLTYGSTVYGVVGVYASDRAAFSDRERSSFGTLGEVAGFAVNAVRHRTLLLSDTLVELTFRVTDRSDPLVGVAANHGATLSLAGVVPREDERLRCYFEADGADPGSIADALETSESIAEPRIVRAYDESTGGTIEATLGPETALGLLAASGATIRSVEVDDGATIVIELPPDDDVRRIAEGFSRAFDSDLRAKREVERPVATAQEFRDRLDDRLTEKQERALRTALLADYFESPRGSSAEEVAETLDITGPTLLYHLRAGQRKLLEAFFERDDR